MTNQEIFKDLGELGTLMLLFLEMAATDEELTDEELKAVLDAGASFTDKDLRPHLDSALIFSESVSFQERVAYLNAGIKYFSGGFTAETKKGILTGLAKIAKVDGTIHEHEDELFQMVKMYLNV
jgi:uncharacterized tellurite resistance protein B-like protein